MMIKLEDDMEITVIQQFIRIHYNIYIEMATEHDDEEEWWGQRSDRSLPTTTATSKIEECVHIYTSQFYWSIDWKSSVWLLVLFIRNLKGYDVISSIKKCF